MRGRWAAAEEATPGGPVPLRRPAVPFPLPDFAISRPTVAIFNAAYYGIHSSTMRPKVGHPEKFFYPLDAIRNWNLLYGRRGFTQYQCVIPESAGPAAVKSFLALLHRTGGSSMLSVIKDCGDEGEGLLSFPMKGTSVALDIPARDGVQKIVDTLNAHLIELGGRVYLAKDRFTRAEDYRRMDQRLEAWRAVEAEVRSQGSTSQRAIGETRTRMKVVTLGATRGIGRSLARLLAERGDSIHVLGRNLEDLAKCAEDLKVRGAAAVSTGPCDLHGSGHVRSGSRGRRRRSRRFRHRDRECGDLRNPGRTRERPGPRRRRADRELHQHHPLLRGGPGPAPGSRGRPARRLLLGRGRTRTQAGGDLRGREGRTLRLPRRSRSPLPAPRASSPPR